MPNASTSPPSTRRTMAASEDSTKRQLDEAKESHTSRRTATGRWAGLASLTLAPFQTQSSFSAPDTHDGARMHASIGQVGDQFRITTNLFIKAMNGVDAQ